MAFSADPFHSLVLYPCDLDLLSDKRKWNKTRDANTRSKELYLSLKGRHMLPKSKVLFQDQENLVEFLEDVNTDLMNKICKLDDEKEQMQEEFYDLIDDYEELKIDCKELMIENSELYQLYNDSQFQSYSKYGPNKKRKL